VILSRGARLCEAIIRASRPHRGGARRCGRPYLARRLGCSPRTVSRYLAELRAADRLRVTPPRRVRTPAGWRCHGVNTYRLPTPNLAPHLHKPRSSRGDTPVTPPPRGGRGPAPGTHLLDPAGPAAALIARILAGHG
jgi:hypothetical protein